MENNDNKLIKNSIFNVMYRIMNVVFPIITSMYIARILLPEKIGIISAAQNIAQYFTLFASMGIPVYGTKLVAQIKQGTDSFDKSFSEIFLINCGLSLVSTFLYYNLILFLPYFEGRRFVYCLTGIPLILNIFNVDWFYQGIQEYAYITVRSFIIKCVSIVLLFSFVHTEDDYINYILINIVAQVGNYGFNIYRLRRLAKLTFHNLIFGEHLRHIFSLFLAAIAAEIYVLADVTLLDVMTDSTTVGFYTMGTRIVSIFKGLVTAITAVFLPQLSEQYSQGNYSQFSRLMNNGLQIILTIAIPVVAGSILCVDDAINVVYGQEYLMSIGVTRILSFSVLSVALSNFIGLQVLVILGYEKITTISTMIGAVTNVCLNVFLIQSMSIVGAAIASVIAEICVTLAQLYFARKYVRVAVNINKVIIAALLMSLFVFFIHQIDIGLVFRLLLEVVVGAIVYVSTLYIIRDKFIVNIIKRILKKTHRKVD